MEIDIKVRGVEDLPSHLTVNGQEYRAVSEDSTMVGKAWIAEYLGISLSGLYKKPWMFPDFGKALEDNPRAKPYKASDIIAWHCIPLAKRKALFRESN